MARVMKDSGITWVGQIPESWSVIANKHVMKKTKKLVPAYNGEDILSLTVNGVVVRDLSAGGKMPTSFDGYQQLSAGNLLMCLFDYDVTPRCIGLIKNEGLTSPAYSQFFMLRDNHAPYYFYYYLMVDHTKELLHLAKNLRHSFTEDQLGEIPVPVPSLCEQQKIASFLDSECAKIDSAIAKTKETIEEYKKLKQSLITKAVTKGLNPDVEMKDSGIEWIGEIPSHWETYSISQIFTQIKNKNLGMTEKNLLSLSYGNIIRKNINTTFGLLPENFEGYNIIPANSIVLRLTDLQNDHKSLRVGISSEQGIITSAYISLLNNSNHSSRFMYYQLHAFDICKGFYGMGAGVRQGLNWEEVKRLRVAVPDIAEEETIVSYLDTVCLNIDSLIAKKEQIVTELESYKKSLIYEYVTGKKEVI